MKAASLLDPRFKNAKRYMTESDLQTTKKFVVSQAFKRARDFPDLANLPPNKSQKIKGPDADNLPASSLVPECVSKSSGRGKRQRLLPAALSGGANSERVRPSSANDILYEADAEEAETPVSTTKQLEHKKIKLQLHNYESYLEARVSHEEVNPLAWWRDRAWQMPHLAEFARDLFSIPGSSHALERAFSRAGRGVDPRRRPRLRRDSAAKLIFCHENCIRYVFRTWIQRCSKHLGLVFFAAVRPSTGGAPSGSGWGGCCWLPFGRSWGSGAGGHSTNAEEPCGEDPGSRGHCGAAASRSS